MYCIWGDQLLGASAPIDGVRPGMGISLPGFAAIAIPLIFNRTAESVVAHNVRIFMIISGLEPYTLAVQGNWFARFREYR